MGREGPPPLLLWRTYRKLCVAETNGAGVSAARHVSHSTPGSITLHERAKRTNKSEDKTRWRSKWMRCERVLCRMYKYWVGERAKRDPKKSRISTGPCRYPCQFRRSQPHQLSLHTHLSLARRQAKYLCGACCGMMCERKTARLHATRPAVLLVDSRCPRLLRARGWWTRRRTGEEKTTRSPVTTP